MSNNENFQLYLKENNKTENKLQENMKNSYKKKTRNKVKKKNDDEINAELIMKNYKTESTQDKTKNNDLILPKIENNNKVKQSHENDINYFSQKKEISNNKIPKQKEAKNYSISNENKININNERKFSEENNIDLEQETFEMDEQKLIEIFNKNKKTLMIICTEIEDNLNNIYFNQGKNNEDSNAMNKTQNINSSNKNSKITKEQKEIIKKINNYKIRIKSAQEELDIQLKLSKADELENTLKERKKYLENIKRENEVLKNIKNFQETDEKEIKNMLNKKEELYSVNEKINKIKGEAKIKKDYNHTLSEKIKSQNDQINSLLNKFNLINQNIEYFKKKQINAIQAQNNGILNNDMNNKIENIDLKEIKKLYEEKVEKIVEKQERIKLKIKEQNTKIKEIINYNEKLSVNIDKIMLKIKNNMSKIMTYENELKRKEILLYDSMTKNKRKNTLSDRKPFHVGSINIKPKTKKIFDYQKYLKEFEKNKNKIKVYSSVDTNTKSKTLKEIEKLRSDIQLSIQNNELDEKIDEIINKIKHGKKNNNIKIINNDEDDVLNNLFKKNDEINGSNRYNFYVTEGANLPVSLKSENINKNFNSNY